MIDQFLWVEKYRPRKIEDCILPAELKKTFKDYVAKGQLPHFLFSGKHGCGKTTVAKAICEEVGADVLFINASLESGIDTVRTTILSFASTVSLSDAKKVIILDEFDFFSANAQHALRGVFEEYASNCRFILTCNHKGKVIPEIQSRCATIDFIIPAEEKDKLMAAQFTCVLKILKSEGVEADNKAVAELVKRYFPDFRKTLGELQKYSVSGRIDSGVLVNTSKETYKTLFAAMKAAKFGDVRRWVALNSGGDSTLVFRELYDNSNEIFEKSSVPNLILFLADYQFKAAFVVDQEINMMACFTEIMAGCKFV